MKWLALVFACTACAPPVPADCPASGTWSEGPYFAVARGGHRAESLPGGRLMVVGGRINVHANDDAGMEVVDLDGRLERYNKAPRRVGHSITRLHDGRVLILGGTHAEAPHQSQPTFLYDPARDSWTFPNALKNAPVYHTATLLGGGGVLLAGGRRNGFWVAPVERDAGIFDAARDRYRALPPLNHARADHTATLLVDGRVLVVGGWGKEGLLGHAELFDPRRGRWLSIAGAQPRASHTATLLSDGRVLFVGGGPDDDARTQLFDPTSLTFAEAAPLVPNRDEHTAIRLAGGAVLVAGGVTSEHGATAEVALFDPGAGAWCRAAPMSQARARHTATHLEDGRVLIAGGHTTDSGMDPFVRTTEIFRR